MRVLKGTDPVSFLTSGEGVWKGSSQPSQLIGQVPLRQEESQTG